MIHLDTNYLVYLLIPRSPEDLRVRTLRAAGESFNISAMAWAEFLCGPVTDDDLAIARALLPAPVAITPDDAALAARLFNATGRRRNSLADCLIAAACMRAGATLATNNVADFRPFVPHGLRLLAP